MRYCLLLIWLISSGAWAQHSADLIPREVLFDDFVHRNIKLAPDGQRVYYQHSDQPASLFYREGPDFSSEKTLTPPTGFSQYEPLNDGRVCYLSQKDIGDELVIIGEQVETLFADSLGLIISLQRDGNSARNDLLAAIHGKEGMEGYYAIPIESDGSMKRVCQLFDHGKVYFDASFNPVAARGSGPNRTRLFYYRKDDEWVLFDRLPWEESMFIGGLSQIVSVSADGKWVFFTSHSGSDKVQWRKLNTNSGKVETIATDGLADMLPWVPVIGPDGHPDAVVALFETTHRQYLDQEIEADCVWLESQIDGDLSFSGFSNDHKTWLVRQLNGGPVLYFVFNREARSLTPLFYDRPHLQEYELANRKGFVVETRDDRKLPLHVYLPPGSDSNKDGIPDKPLPSVMY
ncbi:MAG: hypothetical protein HKN32_05160, partial [Flavobacteriales bacterium]|nr:hypothetical protein [Flavobacteriales bacterium]